MWTYGKEKQSTEWMVAYISGNRSWNSTLYRVVFTILYSYRRAPKMCSGVRISCLQLVSAKLCQRRVKYERNFRHRLGECRSLTFMSSGKVYISLPFYTTLNTAPPPHRTSQQSHVRSPWLPWAVSSAVDICMFVCRQTAGVRVESGSIIVNQFLEFMTFGWLFASHWAHAGLNWKRRESKEFYAKTIKITHTKCKIKYFHIHSD